MCECWYCHWGWAKPVADIYQKHLAELDGDDSVLSFGPSHIVWSDENFDDGSVEFCLNEIATNRGFYDAYSDDEISVVRRSLEELLTIPESVRCCEPADYDDEHPENYPPTVEVVPKQRLL